MSESTPESSDWKRSLLAGVSPFSGCTARQVAEIADLSTEARFPAGAVLCRQGESGNDTYVIVHGEVGITINGEQVATFGAGSLVGEMALVHDGHRSATVTALVPTHALVLAAEEVDSMLAAVPALAAHYGQEPRPASPTR